MNKFTPLTASILICHSLYSLADTQLKDISQEAVDQCRFIHANMERLQCFDHLLGTKLHMNQVEIDTINNNAISTSSLPAFVEQVQDMENKRQSDPNMFLQFVKSNEQVFLPVDGLFPNHIIDKLGEDGFDYYLTKPSSEARQTRRPILSISCLSDITSFQIVLNQPLKNKHSIRLKITDHKEQTQEVRWRVLMDGHVISAPRGLDSIAFVQDFAQKNYIHILSEDEDYPFSIAFSLHDLKEKIPLLAKTCHWSS